jgi:hypothetical protein
MTSDITSEAKRRAKDKSPKGWTLRFPVTVDTKSKDEE